MNYAKLFVSAAVACSLTVGACATVVAAEPAKEPDYRGLYGGVGVGVGDYTHGGSEALWRLDAWLRVHKFGSIQFGYIDMGDPGRGDVDGVTYAAVPQLPLGERFTLHGKIGGMTQTSNDTDTELVFGGGLSVALPYDLGVRADYEHYDFNNNIDAVSFSLYYKFGSF